MPLKTWSGGSKAAAGIVESRLGILYLLSAEMLCGILASDDGGAK